MIFEGIVGVLLRFLGLILTPLPVGEPIGLESVGGIWTGYTFLNGWLPLTEVLAAVGVMLAAYGLLYAIAGVLMIYRLIPFKFS